MAGTEPLKFHIKRSEPEPLTSQSDLTICLAEMEVDEYEVRRGIAIGETWYSYSEALAIAEFVKHHQHWLEAKTPDARVSGESEE